MKVKLPKWRLASEVATIAAPNYAKLVRDEHQLTRFVRSPKSGLIVGTRVHGSGTSQLFAIDPNSTTARLLHEKAETYGQLGLSPDEKSLLAPVAGSQRILEYPVAGGDPACVWDGPSPTGYNHLAAVFAGEARVVVVTGLEVWLMQHAAKLRPLTSLNATPGVFSIEMIGESFALLQAAAKQFIVGIGKTALHLVATIPKSKGGWSIVDGRAISWDSAKNEHREVTNLDEVAAALT